MNKIIVFTAFFIFAQIAQGEEFSLILNKENSFSGKDMVRKYFLLQKGKGSFPGGIEVLPAIVKSDNSRVQASRSAFLNKILAFDTEAQYRKYWIRQKSKGITRKPKEFSDFRKVLRYVQREEGAISFVPSLMIKGSDQVKVLMTFESSSQ